MARISGLVRAGHHRDTDSRENSLIEADPPVPGTVRRVCQEGCKTKKDKKKDKKKHKKKNKKKKPTPGY
jgi:hypothetical protein